MMLFAAGNPFITSYLQSDWFGKGIFWGLFTLSALSWTLIVHKAWLFYQVKCVSKEFLNHFSEKDPLGLKFSKGMKCFPNPLFEIYKAIKQKTLLLVSRNHIYIPKTDETLTNEDFESIETCADKAILVQFRLLEKNLFMLSTIATLGPFLGLLGTVWGILLTFADLHSRGFAGSNTTMLAGLSMALATTVIGLVIAIPAVVGYNYFKNGCREMKRDMEDFSSLLLSSVELQYKRSDAQKISPPN